MHAQSIVRRIVFEASPRMHAQRRESLMYAVAGALDGATLSVTSLGRSMRGPAYEKHRRLFLTVGFNGAVYYLRQPSWLVAWFR